jgi:hypothetical protein
MRTRAALLMPIHNTHSQDNLPESGKKVASKATRAGVAAWFSAPAVHKRIAVDLALLGHDDELLRDLARSVLKAAKQHNANAHQEPVLSGRPWPLGGLPAADRADQRLASCSDVAPGGTARKGHVLARAPAGAGWHRVEAGGGKGTMEKAV